MAKHTKTDQTLAKAPLRRQTAVPTATLSVTAASLLLLLLISPAPAPASDRGPGPGDECENLLVFSASSPTYSSDTARINAIDDQLKQLKDTPDFNSTAEANLAAFEAREARRKRTEQEALKVIAGTYFGQLGERERLIAAKVSPDGLRKLVLVLEPAAGNVIGLRERVPFSGDNIDWDTPMNLRIELLNAANDSVLSSVTLKVSPGMMKILQNVNADKPHNQFVFNRHFAFIDSQLFDADIPYTIFAIHNDKLLPMPVFADQNHVKKGFAYRSQLSGLIVSNNQRYIVASVEMSLLSGKKLKGIFVRDLLEEPLLDRNGRTDTSLFDAHHYFMSFKELKLVGTDPKYFFTPDDQGLIVLGNFSEIIHIENLHGNAKVHTFASDPRMLPQYADVSADSKKLVVAGSLTQTGRFGDSIPGFIKRYSLTDGEAMQGAFDELARAFFGPVLFANDDVVAVLGTNGDRIMFQSAKTGRILEDRVVENIPTNDMIIHLKRAPQGHDDQLILAETMLGTTLIVPLPDAGMGNVIEFNPAR